MWRDREGSRRAEQSRAEGSISPRCTTCVPASYGEVSVVAVVAIVVTFSLSTGY